MKLYECILSDLIAYNDHALASAWGEHMLYLLHDIQYYNFTCLQHYDTFSMKYIAVTGCNIYETLKVHIWQSWKTLAWPTWFPWILYKNWDIKQPAQYMSWMLNLASWPLWNQLLHEFSFYDASLTFPLKNSCSVHASNHRLANPFAVSRIPTNMHRYLDWLLSYNLCHIR